MDTITIRTAAVDDAAALLAIYAPYVEQTAITFEYEVPSLEEFQGRIAHTLRRYPYIVAVENGEILGYAYTGPFGERAAYSWSVETSIYLRQDVRGKGLGKRLYAGAGAYLQGPECAESLRLHRLSRSRRRLSDRQQRGFPHPSGLYSGGTVPPLRLQVRHMVQHDVDGENAGQARGVPCTVCTVPRAFRNTIDQPQEG